MVWSTKTSKLHLRQSFPKKFRGKTPLFSTAYRPSLFPPPQQKILYETLVPTNNILLWGNIYSLHQSRTHTERRLQLAHAMTYMYDIRDQSSVWVSIIGLQYPARAWTKLRVSQLLKCHSYKLTDIYWSLCGVKKDYLPPWTRWIHKALGVCPPPPPPPPPTIST